VAPDGDTPLRLTVQVVVPEETIEDGEQLTPLRLTTGEIDTLVVLVTPVSVAETVTGVTAETDPAVTVKADDTEPTGIVMEDGTGKAAELDERAMVALLCAAEFRVTVQVVLPAGVKDDGPHEMPDKEGATPPVMVMVPLEPVTSDGSPELDTPTTFETEILVLLVRLGFSVTVTVATTPG
jgi:hypothetical protein